MIGVHYHSKVYFILMLMTIYEYIFLCILIVTCIFIIDIVCVMLDFYVILKTLIHGVFFSML